MSIYQDIYPNTPNILIEHNHRKPYIIEKKIKMHYHRQQIWRKPLMFLNIIKAHNFQTGIKITNKQTNNVHKSTGMFTYMYVLLNALSFLLPNADTYPEFCFFVCRGGGGWLLVGMFVQWRGSKTYCWLYYSVYFLKGVGDWTPWYRESL